jgi:CheY-like chemotaxis protein
MKGSIGLEEISSASSVTDSATILLVDDDDNVRDLIRTILRGVGYNVIEAENGLAALQIPQQHTGRIDLLLADVSMPGINGPELARRFSTLRLGTKVLYVSGCPANALRPIGIMEGEARLLPKPFTSDELMRHVHETLGGGFNHQNEGER